MDLMVYALTRETAELKKNGVRIVAIGNVERLPDNVREILQECIQETAGGRRLTLVIALSYSSKWELTEAVRKISDDIEAGILQKEDISEDTICNYLTTHDLPDPDLLIRTGGEQRISNFLLWQSAYAEFYFTETYWPDFNDEELYKAIVDYQKRERRFGKISEQIEPEQ
jgi:undecaprenyl diphosphate synthase